MELTTRRIVDAYAALNAIHFTCRLKYRDARKLSDLKKIFKGRCDVIGKLETDLVKQCGGQIHEDGKIEFSEPEFAATFVGEHNKLFEETDDVDFTPVDMSSYIDNIEIPVESIDALDGIILFDKED